MEKYNTSGARIGAAIVDSFIFVPFSFLSEYLTEVLSNTTGLLILWTSISLSLFQFYSIFMHGKYGQTLGKKSMSIKIVTFGDELPITYRQAFIRDLPYTVLVLLDIFLTICFILVPELAYNSLLINITTILGYAGFFWLLLEIITMLFNDKRRAIHDLIAKTVVIKI